MKTLVLYLIPFLINAQTFYDYYSNTNGFTNHLAQGLAGISDNSFKTAQFLNPANGFKTDTFIFGLNYPFKSDTKVADRTLSNRNNSFHAYLLLPEYFSIKSAIFYYSSINFELNTFNEYLSIGMYGTGETVKYYAFQNIQQVALPLSLKANAMFDFGISLNYLFYDFIIEDKYNKYEPYRGGNSFSYKLGLNIYFDENLSLGLTYQPKIRIDFEAKNTFIENNTPKVSFDKRPYFLDEQFGIGLTYSYSTDFKILFDLNYIIIDQEDEAMNDHIQNYHIGFAYQLNNKTKLRSGIYTKNKKYKFEGIPEFETFNEKYVTFGLEQDISIAVLSFSFATNALNSEKNKVNNLNLGFEIKL